MNTAVKAKDGENLLGMMKEMTSQDDREFLKGMTGMNDEELTAKAKELYEAEITSYMRDEFERRKTERLPLELQWRLNINFLAGNQYMRIDPVTEDVEEITEFAWWEEREVFNQLAPIAETRRARLDKVEVDVGVRPATGEADDVANAKISKQIINSDFEAMKMDKKQMQANIWSERTGTVFFKTFWNPNKGEIVGYEDVEIDEDKLSHLPEFERKLRVSKEGKITRAIKTGANDTMVCTCFEVLPESIYISGVDESRSLMHAKVYDVNEAYERFGYLFKGGKFNVFSVESSKSGNGFGNLMNNTSHVVRSAEKEKSVLILELYELPTALYPEGRLIVTGDDDNEKVLLTYEKLPDKLGDDEDEYGHPFTEQKCLDDGEFYGSTIFQRLIPIQRRYNSLRNRKKEYLSRVSIGQLVYEEDSLDDDILDDDYFAPGALIPYKAGFQAPRYLDNPSLPTAFDTEETSLSLDFNRISGVSEISRDSQAPTGVGSGIALAILKEQDDTRLSVSASNIAEARKEIARKVLRLNHDNVDYERQLRHVGKDNEVSLSIWSSQNITSYDVYLERTSALSDTPAQRRQYVFDLLQAGLFTNDINPKLRAKIFEMMELGNWESFTEDADAHLDRAIRENRGMVKLEQPRVIPFENHQLHIMKHEEFMMTTDYEEMLKDDPRIEQLFMSHRADHMKHIQEAQMKQAKVQQGQSQQGQISQQQQTTA